MSVERDLWLPQFEIDYREVTGQPWPIVTVTKWEENGIGERRFVGARVIDLNDAPPAPPAPPVSAS